MRIAGRSMGWYSFSPKIWTVAPMVNPPAASTIPVIMSNPIQRPQGGGLGEVRRGAEADGEPV